MIDAATLPRMKLAPVAAPFPATGGKSEAAKFLWPLLARNLKNFVAPFSYVEPFAFSMAMLLQNPGYDWQRLRWRFHEPIETINDKNRFVVNAWRAITFGDRQELAELVMQCTWPVMQAQVDATNVYLTRQAQETAFWHRVSAHPHYYDVEIAAMWIYGLSAIAFGRDWAVPGANLEQLKPLRLQLGNGGHGVHRKRVPRIGGVDRGVSRAEQMMAYFEALQQRLSRVRMLSGDWSSAVSGSVLTKNSLARNGRTVLFLDPPYGRHAERVDGLYAVDSLDVAPRVRRWAIQQGSDPRLLIVLCGYRNEHAMPEGWTFISWTSRGQSKQADQEGVWLSPAFDVPQS